MPFFIDICFKWDAIIKPMVKFHRCLSQPYNTKQLVNARKIFIIWLAAILDSYFIKIINKCYYVPGNLYNNTSLKGSLYSKLKSPPPLMDNIVIGLRLMEVHIILLSHLLKIYLGFHLNLQFRWNVNVSKTDSLYSYLKWST